MSVLVPFFLWSPPPLQRLFRALSALFVSALIISVIFASIPLCHNVLLLAIAMAVSGMAMGIIDTIANIQLVTIYQKDSAVFLQVTEFRLHSQLVESVKNSLSSMCTSSPNIAGSSFLHWVWSSSESTHSRPFPVREGLYCGERDRKCDRDHAPPPVLTEKHSHEHA